MRLQFKHIQQSFISCRGNLEQQIFSMPFTNEQEAILTELGKYHMTMTQLCDHIITYESLPSGYQLPVKPVFSLEHILEMHQLFEIPNHSPEEKQHVTLKICYAS